MGYAHHVAVYRNPDEDDYPHPRPLIDLFSRPSKVDLLPLEFQVTIVLAWLLDQSRPFAEQLLQAFCARLCVPGGHRIGARAAVTVPAPSAASSLHPDLSIDVGERAAQLLVEVKVDAAFHTHLINGATLTQPDAYVHAWRQAAARSPQAEAVIRRVGALTRVPAAAPKPASELGDERTRRAAGLSWHRIRDLMLAVADAGDFGRCEVVAREFADLVECRVINLGGAEIADPLLSWAQRLLAEALPAIAACVTGATLGPNVAAKSDYVGRYLRLDFGLEAPVQLWIYVSTADGRYNGGRADANLWLSERPDERAPGEVRSQLEQGGFREVRDSAGGSPRRPLPVQQIQRAGEANAEMQMVVDWALRSLRQAGVPVIG